MFSRMLLASKGITKKKKESAPKIGIKNAFASST